MEETRDMAEAPIADNIDNDDVEINDLNDLSSLIEESRELDKMIDKLCLKRKENTGNISRLLRNRSAGNAPIENMNGLMKESRELDKKIDKLCLMRKENSEMISIRRGTKEFEIDDDVIFEKVTNVRKESKVKLREEESVLLGKVESSRSNLLDHQNELLDMEEENGRDQSWKQYKKEIEIFKLAHQKFKATINAKLVVIHQDY